MIAPELDRHHRADLAPVTPTRGTDADHLTGAATALIGILRVIPAGTSVRRADLDPGTGRVVLEVEDYTDAEQLAVRLGLPADRQVLVQVDGRIRKTWRGHWADWPVLLLTTWTPAQTAEIRRAKR